MFNNEIEKNLTILKVKQIPWEKIVAPNFYNVVLSEDSEIWSIGGKYSSKSWSLCSTSILREVIEYPNRIPVVARKSKMGASGHYNKTFSDLVSMIDMIDQKYVHGFKQLWHIVAKSDQSFFLSYLGHWPNDKHKQEIKFISLDYDASAGEGTRYNDMFYTLIVFEEIISIDDDGKEEKGKNIQEKDIETITSSIFRFTEEDKQKYGLREKTIYALNPWFLNTWVYEKLSIGINFNDPKIEAQLLDKGYYETEAKLSQETDKVTYIHLSNYRTLLKENTLLDHDLIQSARIDSIKGLQDPDLKRVLDVGLPASPRGTILQNIFHKIKIDLLDWSKIKPISVGIDIGGVDPYSLIVHGTTRESQIKDKIIVKPWQEMYLGFEYYYDPNKDPNRVGDKSIAEAMVQHLLNVESHLNTLGNSLYLYGIGYIMVNIDNNNREFYEYFCSAIAKAGITWIKVEKMSQKNEKEFLIYERNTMWSLLAEADILNIDIRSFQLIHDIPLWKMNKDNTKLIHDNSHTKNSAEYAFMYFFSQYHKAIELKKLIYN